MYEDYDDEMDAGDGTRFAQEGSALRAETHTNPRKHPCPNCRQPNRLTLEDKRRGYQCDACADRAEGRFGGDY